MATALHIAPEVREHLREALVEETSLLQALRQARGERLPGDSGLVLYRCSLPVRRLLDPEFVQVVEVEVILRPEGAGWQVVEVRGLALPEA